MAEPDGPQTNNQERPTAHRFFSAKTPLTKFPPVGQLAPKDSGVIAPGNNKTEQPGHLGEASLPHDQEQPGDLGPPSPRPWRASEATLPQDPIRAIRAFRS